MTTQKPGEFIFDQNATTDELKLILMKEAGIDAPAEWKRNKIIQQLKANNGKADSSVAQSLEDAATDVGSVVEASLDKAKVTKDNMVTVKFPVKARIKIAISENDSNDFIAGLNGGVWQIQRGEMVTVPWGLIADMSRQTIKRPITINHNGKTEFTLQETPAHPDISIYEIIYGERTMSKGMADQLRAKGDLV